MPNPEQARRIGFSAGKRLGSAVVRNRCKRRLRECYRLHQLDVPAGMDIIFVARRSMVGAKWTDIVAAFLEALRRSRGMIEKNRSGYMKRLIVWIIMFYRNAISPWKAPCCRFVPDML